MADTEDDIPEVIPEVVFDDDGEPRIGREFVVSPSPIPRTLTIILILMFCFTVGYTVWEQRQRVDAAEAQAVLNDQFKRDIQNQVDDAEADRDRLRKLIEDVIKAKTPEESRAALERFLAAQRAADAERRRRDESSRRAGNPAARPQDSVSPSPSRAAPSRSAKPTPTTTRSSRPTPSRTNSPTPTATSVLPCLEVRCITSLLPPLPTPAVVTLVNADSGDTMDLGLDPQVVARLLGLVVSLLVAVVTKKYASSAVKATANVALAAVMGALAVLVTADGNYNLSAFVNAALNAFVVDIAAYYGFFKPSGIADAVQDKTNSIGVGSGKKRPAADKPPKNGPKVKKPRRKRT